ncbi:hypothetical protein [Achromobacter aloeverae]
MSRRPRIIAVIVVALIVLAGLDWGVRAWRSHADEVGERERAAKAGQQFSQSADARQREIQGMRHLSF